MEPEGLDFSAGIIATSDDEFAAKTAECIRAVGWHPLLTWWIDSEEQRQRAVGALRKIEGRDGIGGTAEFTVTGLRLRRGPSVARDRMGCPAPRS
jgi:hypothetical protein